MEKIVEFPRQNCILPEQKKQESINTSPITSAFHEWRRVFQRANSNTDSVNFSGKPSMSNLIPDETISYSYYSNNSVNSVHVLTT